MSEPTAVPGVVQTKLRVPELPARVVPRVRLLARLCASTERAVLVSGPAGFGKSVLVTHWLRQAARPCAWLSLDDLDNDPKRLLNHLGAALETLDGAAAHRAAEVLRSLRGGADVAHNQELVESLRGLDPATVLVLDDLHVLETGPPLDLLRALLDLRLLPRLVLLTRVNPPLPLGRLRAAGELLELREQDLRFTLDEAIELFAALLPDGLDAELVRRLEQRTEGWAAGLRMAAIALEHAQDRKAAVDAFTGSHRFVADYLLEEAVSQQSAAVQQFLMGTSVLARFTEDACVAVLQDPDARRLLHEVEAANLFLVPLGAERQWYRYHHLFAELLRFRLRRLDPERLDVMHERASRWFEEQGDIAEAIEQAARMSSPDRLVALLDRHALVILGRSEMVSLARWLKHVPDPLQHPYPTLMLSIGWLRVITERAPDLETLFATADAVLRDGPPGYDEAACERVRLEIQILRAYHARFAGRLEEALRTGARVIDELPPESAALSGRILYNQGRTYMMLGELDRAAALLERSIQDNLRAGTWYLVLTGLGQAGAILLETAGVPRARLALEAAVRLAEDRQVARLPAFSTLLYHLGHVLTIADELEAAEPYFERAMALGAMGDMPEGLTNGLVGLARVRAAQGRFDDANRLLLEAEALARTKNAVLMDTDMEIPRARHALYLDAAGHAPLPAALVGGPRTPPLRWTALEEAHCVLHVIAALRSTDPAARAEAARAAARIRTNAEPLRRHIPLCIARVAEALLSDDAGRWKLLDAALREAAARLYVRPLLEIGPPLRPLLQAAAGQPLTKPARAFARRLLERLDADAPAGTLQVGHRPDAPSRDLPQASALTDREREVLRHLCRGLSNKAIARTMFVSPETVKTHLKRVYDKLQVARRRDAVARARGLGLAATPEVDA
jgi:LuxR family transcriptional regulator, maltose regulon positive regulatory protein